MTALKVTKFADEEFLSNLEEAARLTGTTVVGSVLQHMSIEGQPDYDFAIFEVDCGETKLSFSVPTKPGDTSKITTEYLADFINKHSYFNNQV